MSRTVRAAAVALVLCVVTYGIEWQGMGPPARTLATITVDTANHRAVMFGGAAYDLLNDVWVVSLDTMTGYRWEPLATSGTPPSGRYGHSAIYDPTHERMLVFAGVTASGETNELWQLDLTTAEWQQLSPSGTPPTPRVFVSAVYCPARQSMIVFDGKHGPDSGLDELLELDLDSLAWHQVTVPGTRPPPTWSYSASLEPNSNRLLIFGGQAEHVLVNDVWQLDLTVGNEQWTKLNPTGTKPESLSNCASCYVPGQRCLYVFAGFQYPGMYFLNDLHQLNLNTLSWTRLNPTGPIPSERRCPAGAYDPWSENFITFGGETYYGYGNDGPYIHVAELVGVNEWSQVPANRLSPWILVPTVEAGPVHIRYFLPTAGASCVRILDNSGRVVRTLLSGTSPGGVNQLTWDRRDSEGRTVAAGAYFCYLETEQTGISRKFVVTR